MNRIETLIVIAIIVLGIIFAVVIVDISRGATFPEEALYGVAKLSKTHEDRPQGHP